MEQIKLSAIQKREKYRAIIPFMMYGKEEYVYILNPTGEVLERVYQIAEQTVMGELDNEVPEIIKELIDILTNIEIDEDFKVDDGNVTISETIFYINEILTEQIKTCYMNFISIMKDTDIKVLSNKLDTLYEELQKEDTEDSGD